MMKWGQKEEGEMLKAEKGKGRAHLDMRQAGL